MYALNDYGSMKPKAGMFRYGFAHNTGEYTYMGWRHSLEGSNARDWNELTSRYAEDFQLAMLRAVTVTGIFCLKWESDVFRQICDEKTPFEGISKSYMQGQLQADWRFFAKKLALETSVNIHYPCVCPEWLFAYGYSQKQYLSDLALYWDNIHDNYFTPWEITRIGQDSPEVARLKKLGQYARAEIDQVARHSKHHLKR